MLRPYLPPYASAALADSPRQSVPGVLLDQRIGVDLRLRNRHQHVRGRARTIRPVLELPTVRVLAVPDQILAPLPLGQELEETFLQDHRLGDGPGQRRGDGDGTGADPVQRVERACTSGR